MDTGIIIIGNNVACQIIRIGTIRIKMSDGVIRYVTDVRYITQIKKNIRTVGAVR